MFLIGLNSIIGPLAGARWSELCNTTGAGQREGFKGDFCLMPQHLVTSLAATKGNDWMSL
jgi:hypothetical protein